MRKTEQPKASLRGRLTGDFIASLQAQWAEHGDAILDQLRVESPSKFAEIVSRLCPTEAVVTQGNFDGLSKEELRDLIIEGASRNLAEYEDVLRRARKLAQQRQAALPPELPANRRARLMREAQRQQGSNGQWTSTG